MCFFDGTRIISEKEHVVIWIIQFLFRYHFNVICHGITLPVASNI